MKIKNQVVAIILVMVMSLSACGGSGNGGEQGEARSDSGAGETGEGSENPGSGENSGGSLLSHISPGPVVVLTQVGENSMELRYYPDVEKPEESVLIREFDNWDAYQYFSGGEDGVIFSEDGEYLYYFDEDSELADVGVGALYRASIQALNEGNLEEERIDDNVITSSIGESYAMECLDGGRLLYMGVAVVDGEYRYALSLYEQGASTTLLTGQEIFVSVSSDKTLANIAVRDEAEEYNPYAWYRMELDDSPEPVFVCQGTLWPEVYATQDYDYQLLTDHDLILNFYTQGMDYGMDYSYYSLDLYKGGEWQKTIDDAFPWSSVGPFGITADKGGDDISFYTISTAEGNAPTGETYQGEAQEWAFFRYENGSKQEMTQIPRFRGYSPGNEVDLWSIRTVGGEVLYGMMDDLYGATRSYKIYASDGEEILLEDVPSAFGGDHEYVDAFALNVRTRGESRQLIEDSFLGDTRYILDGKQYLSVNGPYQYLCLSLDELAADPAAVNPEVIDTEEKYIENVIPYAENGQLVLTQSGLYKWNGRKLRNTALQDWLGDTRILEVWTRARMLRDNIPNIY